MADFGPLRWLEKRIQRRANNELWRELCSSMPFLVSHGTRVEQRTTRALPFDYASIYLSVENLIVCVTRGQGLVSATITPPGETLKDYELISVLRALSDQETMAPKNLGELDQVLKNEWTTIVQVFSDPKSSAFSDLKGQIEESLQRRYLRIQ